MWALLKGTYLKTVICKTLCANDGAKIGLHKFLNAMDNLNGSLLSHYQDCFNTCVRCCSRPSSSDQIFQLYTVQSAEKMQHQDMHRAIRLPPDERYNHDDRFKVYCLFFIGVHLLTNFQRLRRVFGTDTAKTICRKVKAEAKSVR
jgi:hypothetical protein